MNRWCFIQQAKLANALPTPFPLLAPARRPQAPAKRSRGWRNLPAVVIAAVLASLLDRAVLYLRTPTPVLQPWPGAAHDPQHAQHLHALHHNPSDEFCAAEPPLVCAHGGDSSGGAPVNTLEAFEAALQQGVPCLEVDVARTSDGQLVVLHPRDLAQLLASESGNASGSGSGSDGSGSGPAAQAGTCSNGEESCDAAADPGGSAAGQEPLPQVGDFSWGKLAALRWPGGQRVATAEEVLRLVVPAAQHITLDVKGHAGKVSWGEWVGAAAGSASSAGSDEPPRLGWVACSCAVACTVAMLPACHKPRASPALCSTCLFPIMLQGGEADEKVLAAAVVDLIAHTDCRQCLVWAKSDGLVSRSRWFAKLAAQFSHVHGLRCLWAVCMSMAWHCWDGCAAAACNACTARQKFTSLPPWRSAVCMLSIPAAHPPGLAGAACEGAQPCPASGLHRFERDRCGS